MEQVIKKKVDKNVISEIFTQYGKILKDHPFIIFQAALEQTCVVETIIDENPKTKRLDYKFKWHTHSGMTNAFLLSNHQGASKITIGQIIKNVEKSKIIYFCTAKGVAEALRNYNLEKEWLIYKLTEKE